jgi:hypothetical protein
MSSLIPAVPKHKQAWYRKENNTSALIRFRRRVPLQS